MKTMIIMKAMVPFVGVPEDPVCGTAVTVSDGELIF